MALLLENIQILDICPSQFYLCKEKLEAIRMWFDPQNLQNFDPLPVKLLEGDLFFTDGHSRAFVAMEAGLTTVPLVWDNDDMDWEAYRLCVRACRTRGIHSIADLSTRILPELDYRQRWNGWCDVLHEVLSLQRRS